MLEEEASWKFSKTSEEFGFGAAGLKAEDFTIPDEVIQLGVASVRIDVVTSISLPPQE